MLRALDRSRYDVVPIGLTTDGRWVLEHACTQLAGWAADPHLYADKILDMTDLADYLGKKYGGWGPLPERFGKKDSRPLFDTTGTKITSRLPLVLQHGILAVSFP